MIEVGLRTLPDDNEKRYIPRPLWVDSTTEGIGLIDVLMLSGWSPVVAVMEPQGG